jgi:drug/metabolite transporter (DMT)-like permease
VTSFFSTLFFLFHTIFHPKENDLFMNATDQQGLSPAITAGAGALFIFFWASGFVSAKFGLLYAEPFTFLILRFLLALAFLIPMCLIWKAQWPQGIRLIGHVALAGFLVQTVYLIGVFYSIWLGVSTGVVALIVGLQPLLTGALAGAALGEKVSPRQWAGLALGFAGLALVVAEKVDFAGSQGWGAALCGLSLIGITVGTLYQKRYCADVDIRCAVSIQNGVSFLVIAPLALTFETMRIDWTGEFVFALTWSAMGLSVIAIALYYLLVRNGAAAKVTSLLYLSPPTTALMGWLMFGETFSLVALSGLAVAVAGVWLANRREP